MSRPKDLTIGNASLLCGDALEVLRTLPAESVQTCVTSPPYWGLRDYGAEGQIGLEDTPDAYVARLVEVFREVRRVLRDDGTCWLNLGDSYAGGAGGRGDIGNVIDGAATRTTDVGEGRIKRSLVSGLKPKDLVGIPWMVAFALRADGWYLRSDIIWAKPNPMPESVTDRPTKAHEYLFLLSKSATYFYDSDAVREPLSETSLGQLAQARRGDVSGARRPKPLDASRRDADGPLGAFGGGSRGSMMNPLGRNKRSVWTVSTKPYTEAHFATYPVALIEPCILAGTKPGDAVLDPFSGAGTTGVAAIKNGRRYVGIELNPEYLIMSARRIANTPLSLDWSSCEDEENTEALCETA